MRLSEERSNELATPSLVTKSAHLGTFIKKRASSETTAIILITYPNPFRDSLRSLQAKTFALFNKDAAVLSCKKSNRKVEMRSLQLLSWPYPNLFHDSLRSSLVAVRKSITRLKRLDSEFKSAKSVVMGKDGDLDAYFELVDTYKSALSAANSASYTTSMDFLPSTLRRWTRQYTGGTRNLREGRRHE